jgi:hypothetical protein
LPSFSSQKTSPPTRWTHELVLNKSSPWGFFDGASQQALCGGGGLLYSPPHTILSWLLALVQEQTIMHNLWVSNCLLYSS